LLKAAIAGQPCPYRLEELHELARHCTEQEDDASKIERQVRKSAAALLLESRIGQRFEGVVTGASDKGTWVRVFNPPVEGRVVRGYERLDVGDRVRVQLVEVDVERGFIDFAGMSRGDRDAQVFEGFRADAFRTALGRASKAAGVPDFSPHDLRDRRATLWHLGGIPVAQAAEWLGHTPHEHLRTYVHATLEDRTELDYATVLGLDISLSV
jgi:hypothetical protein